MSDTLLRGLAPGTIVRLALPQGDFVLPDPPPAKGIVLDRRQRDHASDVDAAHTASPRHSGRRSPHSRGAKPRAGDLPR